MALYRRKVFSANRGVNLSSRLIFSFSVFFASTIGNTYDIQETLSTIPLRDQIQLEDFFRSLFIKGDFAYVLFGDKPMASIDYSLPLFLSSNFHLHLRNLMIIDLKGWKIWEKYQHLFPLQNFYFYRYSFEKESFSIIFIHKKRVADLIKQHYCEIRENIGKDLNEREIRELVFSGNFFSLNFPSKKMIGIFFGYPIKSCRCFDEKQEILHFFSLAPYNFSQWDSKTTNALGSTYLQPIRKLSIFDSINDDFSYYQKRLSYLIHHFSYRPFTRFQNPLSPITIPGCMISDDDAEIEKTISSYDSQKKHLIDIFYSPDFLIKVLQKLTSL